ncbi:MULTISPECIES: peptidase domain-containing ABC transporter [unclassified Sphingobacterium]|uniref:peptidase domain-containing ABC transporter n=1 Tax=unclassified Sphingobacterium TaxID=2609468 RepID=UPI0025ED773A|nr:MULTISPECIES: peptidase domain-containing ABC transporter [unclassified Sphingobacterium]
MFNSFPHFNQLDAKDCGPACIQIVARHYGKFFDLDYLREITNVSKEGTSVYNLCESSEAIGLKSMPIRTSFTNFREKVPLPCIIHWRGYHYIVVYKITKNYVYVSDPAIGLMKYTIREFVKGWLKKDDKSKQFKTGILIALEPTDAFNDVKASRETPSFIYIFNYLILQLSPYKRQCLQLLFVIFLITIIRSVFPIITQSIVDTGIVAKDLNFITLLSAATVILVISSSIGTWISQSLNMHIAARIKISLLSNYILKLFKLPVTFFENKLVGDVLQRSMDYERLQNFIMNSAFGIILSLLNIIVFGSILYFYTPSLSIIFLFGSILYILWTFLFWNVRKKMDIRYFDLLAKNNSHWIETLTNIQDIKLNNYEKGKRWKWEKLQIKLYETNIKLLNVSQIEKIGGDLINTLKDVILTYFTAYLVITGEMTIGMMVAIQFILGQLRAPLAEVIQFITSYQSAYISFIRMNEVNQIREEQDPEILNNLFFPLNKELIVNNLSYRYTGQNSPVLLNLSFVVPEGKFTAIVGESGSGKSTLLKILTRLYEPSAGEYLLGKANISNVSLKLWRDNIGVVSQECSMFNDSIRNNIILDLEFDNDKFYKAVSCSNILPDVERMPKGFNTMIGENGKGLSQGQKQRIMIARALYREPDYLFFDEATNGLDSINEVKVLSNINQFYPGKTIIIVAHRLSTIKSADQIIVLNKGTIVEIGKHEILLNNKRYYSQLYNTQMHNFYEK